MHAFSRVSQLTSITRRCCGSRLSASLGEDQKTEDQTDQYCPSNSLGEHTFSLVQLLQDQNGLPHPNDQLVYHVKCPFLSSISTKIRLVCAHPLDNDTPYQ